MVIQGKWMRRSGAVARLIGVGMSREGDGDLLDDVGLVESSEGPLDGAFRAMEVACNGGLGDPAGVLIQDIAIGVARRVRPGRVP